MSDAGSGSEILRLRRTIPLLFGEKIIKRVPSLKIDPRSRYWYACITLPNGRQTQVSTKLRIKEVTREKALLYADTLEKAYRVRRAENQRKNEVARNLSRASSAATKTNDDALLLFPNSRGFWPQQRTPNGRA